MDCFRVAGRAVRDGPGRHRLVTPLDLRRPPCSEPGVTGKGSGALGEEWSARAGHAPGARSSSRPASASVDQRTPPSHAAESALTSPARSGSPPRVTVGAARARRRAVNTPSAGRRDGTASRDGDGEPRPRRRRSARRARRGRRAAGSRRRRGRPADAHGAVRGEQLRQRQVDGGARVDDRPDEVDLAEVAPQRVAGVGGRRRRGRGP